jgi:hypothetical protein
MTPAGFPHSDIPGSKTVCVSPRLFAACHVLHRLLVPRHPPCTLSSLTGFSKVLQLCIPSVSYSIVNERPRRSTPRAPQRGAKVLYRSIKIDASSLDSGGDSGARTRSLRLAKPALSQLSYIPNDPAEERCAGSDGGPEWTRTTHLTLIRRAL